MAVVRDNFRLTNNDNSNGIKFAWGGNLTDAVQVNALDFPLAGADSTKNITVNLGGYKRIVSFDFRIENTGSDQSTNTQSKVTVNDQWDFVLDDIVQANSTGQHKVTFTIQVYRFATTKTYSGMLQNIQINPRDGTGHIEGTLIFSVGANPF